MCGRAVERRITMSKKDRDIALFVAFCIEEYGAAKGMMDDQGTFLAKAHYSEPLLNIRSEQKKHIRLFHLRELKGVRSR